MDPAPTLGRPLQAVNTDQWTASTANNFLSPSPPQILSVSESSPSYPLRWLHSPAAPPGTMSVDASHASAPQDAPPAATVPPATSTSTATNVSAPTSNPNPNPNPRSCVTCRRRKVKCDKKQPCSNCVRAKIECIFPGPGRAPRKSRKPPDTELMERLRRLEGVVQTLNAQVEEHEHEAAERDRNEQSRQASLSDRCKQDDDRSGSSLSPGGPDVSVEALESRFGRLVVDQGRSRYINNSFWASLNNEVEDLRAILIEPSDDEDDGQSPQASESSSQHQGFIFGYSSTSVDMLSLHPTPERALEYWEIFKENVDPLIKVLHIPSFEPVLLDAMSHPEKVPKGLESLMFAIYYGGVTSLPQGECMKRWGEQRNLLLQKLRFALEQALARANFLYCDEIVVLKAFVIFLIVLRRNEDARKIWTLTGLVVRNAQTLGIHRDGSHFDLPPFQIEMRRRLWWQVCILDARSSEDHGCDPTIIEAQFDTKMPLNVNDSELWPGMKELPEERKGFTDITFCLIRMEVANIFRRILHVPPGPVRCNEFFANLTIEQKEKWISESHQRLEEKYLKDCDMSDPICWVAATISRLIMSKMWLIVYHPYQRKDGGASLPQETKDKLFITSLENLEYSMLLETEARTMKWGWLFRTYVQWHAIAFLLSELCVRTKGEAVDRAWRALESTAGRWLYPLSDESPNARQNGCLWRPLRKLMAKARAARARELAIERATEVFRNQNPAFGNMSLRLDHMSAGSPLDQSSVDVDRMLSPAPPRVGEKLRTSLPALPSEPIFGQTPTSPNGGIVAGVPSPPNAGVDFQHLTTFGMDYVIGDVMEGMTYEGPSPTSFSNPNPIASPPLASLTNSHPNTNMNINTSNFATAPLTGPATGVGTGTAQSRQFPNSIWDDLMADSGDSSGPNSASPVIDGGNMDWAVWDDLVSQYGRDDMMSQFPTGGMQNMNSANVTTNGNTNGNGNPNVNGAAPVNGTTQGHLGMVHWF